MCGSQTQRALVVVTDNCDGCDPNTLYISPAAYDTAFSASVGRASGGVTLVPCQPPAGITVRVVEYRVADGGYMRLAFLDVAQMGAVTGASIRAAGGDWQPMTRSFGASWDAYTVPAPPLDLRLYQNDNYVDLLGAITQAGATGDFPTSRQFGSGVDSVGGAVPSNATLSPPAAELAVAPLAEAAPRPEAMQTPAAEQPGTISLLGPLNESASPPVLEAVSPPAAEALSPPAAEPVSPPALETVTLPPVAVPMAEPAAEGPAGAIPAPAATVSAPEAPAGEVTVGVAPVSFIPASAAQLETQPAAAGPLSAEQVAANPGFDATECEAVLQTLRGIPEVSSWVTLLTNVGLSVMLSSTSAQATMLVPVNSALDAPVDGYADRNVTTLAGLINVAPELANPLVAYHVGKGLWPSWTLEPGTELPTSATLDKVNLLTVTAEADGVLQGIGSSATILQPNIAACGPSVIHIIDQVGLNLGERERERDIGKLTRTQLSRTNSNQFITSPLLQVLLPFTFDQKSLDAITATQVPASTATAGRR